MGGNFDAEAFRWRIHIAEAGVWRCVRYLELTFRCAVPEVTFRCAVPELQAGYQIRPSRASKRILSISLAEIGFLSSCEAVKEDRTYLSSSKRLRESQPCGVTIEFPPPGTDWRMSFLPVLTSQYCGFLIIVPFSV
jgi:hypothetical protein